MIHKQETIYFKLITQTLKVNSQYVYIIMDLPRVILFTLKYKFLMGLTEKDLCVNLCMYFFSFTLFVCIFSTIFLWPRRYRRLGEGRDDSWVLSLSWWPVLSNPYSVLSVSHSRVRSSLLAFLSRCGPFFRGGWTAITGKRHKGTGYQ